MLNSNVTRKDKIKAIVTMAIGLTVLGMFIVALGGHRFWEDLSTYYIRFDGVRDLSVGRPVKYAGLDIGRVVEIGLDPDDPAKIKVAIGTESTFQLFEGTVASISQKGLVGDNYVLLELRGAPGPRLVPGTQIPAASAPDMNELTRKIGKLADSVAPKLTRIADSIESILDKENTKNIKSILAGVPAILDKANSTLARIDNDWAEVSKTITEGRAAIVSLNDNLDNTLDNVDGTVESVGRDMSATLATIRANVEKAGGGLESLTSQVERNMDYDQERLEMVMDNLESLTRDLKQLSRSLRERPWQLIHKPNGEPAQ